MSETTIALLGYIAWTMMLLGLLGLFRSYLTLSGKRAANNFLPSGEDVSPFSNRLCRAHANCFESFPIIGGVLLFAVASDQQEISNSLAYYVLGARLLQSTIHLLSTSLLAVLARFGFFLVQIGICAYWLVKLFGI